MIKKMIGLLLLILTGYFLGNHFLQKSNQNQYYFLEEGIYQDSTIFESNIENLKQKIIEYHQDEIHIYCGITRELEIAKKIQEIYQKENKDIQIREKRIKNEELKVTIEQYDILAKKTNNKEELFKIEEVALASYGDIIKKIE